MTAPNGLEHYIILPVAGHGLLEALFPELVAVQSPGHELAVWSGWASSPADALETYKAGRAAR